jgi:hypothetical protein
MFTRGWELVTTDGPTAVAESLLDAIVVKNGEGDRSLAGTAGTSESIGNRCQFFGETDDPPDQSRSRPKKTLGSGGSDTPRR